MTEPSSNLIRQLTETIAASREVADRRIDALNAAVERTTQNVDRALEGMQRYSDRMEQSANRIEHQVGLMSEHLTALDFNIERLTDQIRELTNAVNGHLRVAEKQAENITELTKLVATQANTVAILISRTG
jgi:methyl-accepting chemotaxis protein